MYNIKNKKGLYLIAIQAFIKMHCGHTSYNLTNLKQTKKHLNNLFSINYIESMTEITYFESFWLIINAEMYNLCITIAIIY